MQRSLLAFALIGLPSLVLAQDMTPGLWEMTPDQGMGEMQSFIKGRRLGDCK